MTTLAKFLAAKEPLFDLSLRQLETRTGKQGVDAKLTGEIASVAARKTQALGLPLDCSGPELYAALINQVRLHDEHFARAIGGQNPTDLAEMIPLIVTAAQRVEIPRDGWFVKESVIDDFLRRMPPQDVMTRLGYDSVDTMLARENIYELLLALRFAQPADWLNQYNELYRQLKPDDFEVRDIKVVTFDTNKWGDIAMHFIQKKLHNIANSKEMGAIGVMPMTLTAMPGVTLKVFPLLMHYFNEIRLYSAFFKLVKARPDFGEVVAETLIADTPQVSLMAGQTVHWRVIQRYFGKLKGEYHPEIFEPHVHPEDLHWRKAEEIMYDVDPELEFWRDLDYVAVLKGGDIVTFNLMDVSLSYSNQLSYANRYIYHFRESLWNEIFARYFSQKTLEEQILHKLDNAFIAPEKLKV